MFSFLLVVFAFADQVEQDSLGMRVTGLVVQGDMKEMSFWGWEINQTLHLSRFTWLFQLTAPSQMKMSPTTLGIFQKHNCIKSCYAFASSKLWLIFTYVCSFCCSNFGPVQDVRIPYQQKRMFGFVTFLHSETVRIILARGNPHFICDSRVLVKPYKEKGRILEKYVETT